MTFFFFVKKNDSTAIISITSSFSEARKGREVYGEAGKTEERRKRIGKLLLVSFLLQIILRRS